jgi:putative membrane protein
MKKNNLNFLVPQRQSGWAIIFIVLKFLRKLVGQVWPILLAFFLGKSGNGPFDKFELLAAGLGTFGMVTSIISYFKYYYYVSEEELVIEKGILKKVKLNLPFERIQSINFQQTVIHQFLNVTAVEVETAGSDKTEIKIDALDLPSAECLRKLLLEKRAAALSTQAILEEDLNVDYNEEPTEEIILELNNRDLIKVGLAQNHLKPIGLVFGLVGSLFLYGYTMDFDAFEIIKEAFGHIKRLQFKEGIIWMLLLPFLMVGYSIVTTILRHYKLRFWRSNNRFQVTQGLLTKNQHSALDQKIQILAWGQNPFERLLKQYRINFSQAKSGEKKSEKSQFTIPGCDEARVQFVKDAWIGEDGGHFETYMPVSIHFFKRAAIYESMFFMTLLGILIFFEQWQALGAIVVVWALVIFLSWKEYKKKRYAYNGKEIYIGGGMIGYKSSLFPTYKVQNLTILQNPYQWRRDLATLRIDTAAGSVSIPFISYSEALHLFDQLTYAVEKSKKKWM